MKHYTILEKDILKINELKNLNKELKLLYLILTLNADYNGYIDNANQILNDYDFNKEQLTQLIKSNVILKSPFLKDLYIDRFNPVNRKTTQKRLYSQYDNLHRNLMIDNNGYYYFNNQELNNNETKEFNEIVNEIDTTTNTETNLKLSDNNNINWFIEFIVRLSALDNKPINEYLKELKNENNINYRTFNKNEKNEIDIIVNDLTNKFKNSYDIIEFYNI